MEDKLSKIWDEYEREINNFDVCAWGSCQYKTAYDTYVLVTKLIEVRGVEPVKLMFGVKDLGVVKDQEDFEHELYLFLMEQTSDEEDDYDQRCRQYLARYQDNQRVPIVDYFEFTKNASWDLWSAYIGIDWFMPGAEVVDHMYNLPTYGPVLNVMAQEDNFLMGLSCALLTYYYGVPSEAFDGFDT